MFIVRNDANTAKMIFQTSDTTWQAYNNYGGNSLYVGGPGTNPGRAYKVSYNRPFNTREVDGGQDWVFNAEYPMVRWLEANGYDLSYLSGVDSDRTGSLLLNHKVYLSVGHDEYWSGQQRTNVEAARNAGVNLAFFSGNEVFWKTRWENSIDSSNTRVPHARLVQGDACGREDRSDHDLDGYLARRPIQHGWRQAGKCADGHDLQGQHRYGRHYGPGAFGKLRFWRNTGIAQLGAAQTATLPDGTLGYEWDEAPDDASTPAGLLRLSATTASDVQVLQDLGSNYAVGTARHALTLYRHSSGALVFGAGTIQWPWGLDDVHDRAGSPSDINMRQATVNLFADMGVQPNTLQGDLLPADASTDTTAPTVAITSPTAGGTAAVNTTTTISGTATDTGGEVGAVQVSADGGATWRTATVTRTGAGTATWSLAWTPTVQGNASLVARAVDDSVNRGANSAPIIVSVGAQSCPCSFWSSVTVPATVDGNDAQPVTVGLNFTSDVGGTIIGCPFLQGSAQHGYSCGCLVDGYWHTTGHGDIHRRVSLWLAADEFRDAGDDSAEHRICGFLLHANRSLLERYGLLRRQRRDERTASCAR